MQICLQNTLACFNLPWLKAEGFQWKPVLLKIKLEAEYIILRALRAVEAAKGS
jgi:hypothetical protein